MRGYSTVAPQFWIGTTGKALRKAGPATQVVALYLLTSPHANMIGLYYLPMMYLAHETGLPLQGASKALRRAIEAGFCEYDEASEVVWVREMAAYQIGDRLDAKDKRCLGIQRTYDALPENPFLSAFFQRYCDQFHMTAARGQTPKTDTPLEGASMPLRSQEQEQEQEQEQCPLSGAAREPTRKASKKPPAKTTIPEDFALDDVLRQYASSRLPSVDTDALLESFRGKALAKGWKFVNWRQAFQEFVRNSAPDSGHWAAGQYPKAAAGRIQWQ